MTGVLTLRTRSAWRGSRGSLLVVALLVFLTVAVTVTAVAGARRTRSAPARFLREDATPDVMVSMDPPGSLRGVPELARLPQVQTVSVNAAVAAFPLSKTGDYMPVLAPIDDTAGITIDRGRLLAGRRPDLHAADEIMLSEAHARALGAHLGARIPLVGFDVAQSKACLYSDSPPPVCAKLFRTPRYFVRVVGITRTAADVNNRAHDITVSILGGGFFARHRDDIGWNAIVAVRLRPGASPNAFVTAARRVLPAGVQGGFDLVNANASFDAVDVLATGLFLFALVAGLAGAFAVGQAAARQVRSDDADRDLLAALGATRSELFADALLPVVLAAALGIAAGVVAAYLASEWMPIGFARRVDPSPGRRLDGVVVLAGVAICTAFVASVVIGAVRSSRRRTLDRGAAPVRNAIASFAATPAASVGLHHACNPGRGRGAVPLRSAFIGVAAATAGIVGVLGFSAALAHLVHTPALYGWTFDVAEVNSKYTARVVADPDVAAVADVYSGVPLRVNDRPTFGQSFAARKGHIGPAIVSGRVPTAKDEVALGADTIRIAHTRIGGRVSVAGPDGRLTARVVGQAVFPTGADAYPLADGAVVARAALATLGRGDSPQALAVRYRPGVDRAAAFARLDALDASDPTADPPTRPAPPAEVEKLRQVDGLPKLLAAFLALLGVVALGHALVVGARRRARDFAVLRALGFRRRNVRSAVSWEAGALAGAGAAIGIPLGIVLARFAWARTAHGIGVLAVHQTAVLVVVVIVPVAVVLAIGVALVPARRAVKLRPAETLRSE